VTPTRRAASASPVGRGDVALSVLLSLAIAAGLWELWRRLGPGGSFEPGLEGHGPDPAAWPRLIALWLPASQALFAAAYAWLACRSPRAWLRRLFLLDQAVSLAAAAGAAAALAALADSDALHHTLGAGYVLVVGAKTGILLRAVWRWLIAESPGPRPATVALFLGGLLPYLFLGAHVVTTMSATGDEPYYLMVTHSLVHDRDLDLADNFARVDYLPFYWGRLTTRMSGVRTTEDGRIYADSFQGLQPLWLAPGYWAAGRAGTVVIVNLAGALAVALVFRLALLAGASSRAAFLAWLGAAFSVPAVSFAVSPWPEMTGAFFATSAAVLLLRAPRPRAAIGAAAILLVLLVATKTRLFLLALPIMTGFVRRPGWRAVGMLGAAGVAAFVMAFLFDTLAQGGHLMARVRGIGLGPTLGWLVAWTVQAPMEYRGHLGLLLDQEFGALASAPALALALAGAAAAAGERRWRCLLVTAGPFVLAWYYLGSLGASRSRVDQHWHGGFSPAGRFLVAALPLLWVWAATMLDRLRGRLAWSIVAGLYVVTLGQTLLASIRPAWRFNRGIGRATPLVEFFAYTGLDPGRLLPSYVSPGDAWVAPGLGALVAIVLAGWFAAGRPGTAPPRGAWILGAVTAVVLALSVPLVLWLHPTGEYPAILGRGRGGTPFHGVIQVDTGVGTAPRERLVWAAQRPGEVELAPRLPPGRYRVVVSAGAQGVPGGPRLRIGLDGSPGRLVPMDSAVPPAWLEREYVTEIAWAGGRLPIRIELGEVSGTAPARLAYIRAVRITALDRAAGAPGWMAGGPSP
jgi:hypothetical protein